ncbi:MAG: hypothetical protein JJU10_03915 [Idiomarina sp.]|nr:hypothetical protein [Idiomarina sp.]
MSRTGQEPNRRSKTWILFAFVIAVAVLIGFRYVNQPKQSASAPLAQTEHGLQSTSNISPSSPRGFGEVSELDTSDFSQCEAYLRNLTLERARWGRENYRDWARYLEQGYSLDDVTLIVERFANPNFAASFRAEQLRKGSKVALQNEALMEELQRQVPEAVEMGISVQRGYPNPWLESFETMSESERRQVLADHPVSVDDAAYFVHAGLSDEYLLMMLDRISDVDATVNFNRLEATSLLDYAIFASRPAVVEMLLRRGASPTSDAHLGSSMEWALSRLGYANDDIRAAAVEVVRLLKRHGAAARFELQRENRVEGHFPRHSYRFREEQILSLWQDYQLNLMQIESRELPVLDEHHPLIETLNAKRDAYLSENKSGENYRELRTLCQHTLREVNRQWQPESSADVLNRVIALYEGSPERIISELADIDPLLVDIYRTRLVGMARPGSRESELQDVMELLNKGETAQAIRYLEAQSYSDDQKRRFVIQMLSFNAYLYPELSRSALWVDDLQFFDLLMVGLREDLIRSLDQAGANLRGVDRREKTLLYYATQRLNVSLVRFLKEQGYPSSFDSQGEDPLHVALGLRSQGQSLENPEKLVDILMTYRPTIDTHHQSRMALIQLRYPWLYESLTNRHPELVIDSDTPLPPVR